jgi:hypothetical protein
MGYNFFRAQILFDPANLLLFEFTDLNFTHFNSQKLYSLNDYKIHKKIQSNIHFSGSNSTGTSVVEQFRANKSIQSINNRYRSTKNVVAISTRTMVHISRLLTSVKAASSSGSTKTGSQIQLKLAC